MTAVTKEIVAAMTSCDHNFIVNQQGLKVCKECYFVETKLIPISEVEKIKKECSNISMLLETTLGSMKPGTHYYRHLELAQAMLNKIWFPYKTNKEKEDK